MTIVKHISISVMAALVLTLALGAISILVLMFSVHDDRAYKTGLFGSVFFRVEPNEAGNIVATMGVASALRFGLLAVVIFVLCLLLSVVGSKLLEHHRSLSGAPKN